VATQGAVCILDEPQRILLWRPKVIFTEKLFALLLVLEEVEVIVEVMMRAKAKGDLGGGFVSGTRLASVLAHACCACSLMLVRVCA
jgi:hypothetical protein